MNILVATPIYPPESGGPARYTKELSRRIAEGNDVTILAYTDSAEVFPNTKLLAVSKMLPLPVRLFKYTLLATKCAKTNDVMYVQNAMAAGLPVAIASMISGTPFILKFVGDEAWERATQRRLTTKRLEEFLSTPIGSKGADGDWKISLMRKIQGFVLRRARFVTTPSAYLRDELIKAYGIAPERAIVNYNASEDAHASDAKPERIHHQMTTTARLVSWKGIDGMIDALAILKQQFADAKLVIAGDGPEMENLKLHARNKGVGEDVTFLGNIPQADVLKLNKKSAVYIQNSTYEGLPHTVLEAFASEVPVIGTDIPGTNEAVYHEKTGLLVPAGDSKALAAAIKRIFEETDLCVTITEGGKKLLAEKFSWKSHISNLTETFQKMASELRKR